MTPSEYHVASFVLRVRPEKADEVRVALERLAGAELHIEETAAWVVTIEAEDTRQLAERAQSLADWDGVLQLSPVFHGFDPVPETDAAINTNEEIENGS
jgi:nitrate reductase NapD